MHEEKAELEETASQLQDIVTEHKQLLTDTRAYRNNPSSINILYHF
ncbi:hypothetical protein J4G08_19750 [Candidatus Poribacteria bacterium]|nr:hypothetical protein [Candidatus Poribacteria bacterium]